MAASAAAEVRDAKAVLGYAPTTFLERGVLLPFTTPLLCGARVRPGHGSRQELILGNPSGGRGVYILPWDGVFALCKPTLHDRILYECVQSLRALSPRAIRRQSLETAHQGVAGRSAAAAAATVSAADAQLLTLTTVELLMALVQQVSGEASRANGHADLQAHARRAVAAVAPAVGKSPDVVPAMLEELAAVFAPLGVGTAAARAPIPSAIATVAAMADGLRNCFGGPLPMSRPDAGLILAAADLTVACARATLADAISLLLNLPALLRGWAQAPAAVTARAARAEWLLDGWHRICVLWQDDPSLSNPQLSEMADLIPATPREIETWVPSSGESAAGVLRQRRRVIVTEETYAAEAVLELVARNERLLARALVVS